MRRLALLAFLAAIAAAPISAQAAKPMPDGDCWARFTLVRMASEANPDLLEKMGVGASEAMKTFLKANPQIADSSTDDALRAYALALDRKLKAQETSGDKVIAEINACEAAYGLPVTDFTKVR